jgi:phosphatidylglycerol lysyltransferase
LGRMLHRFTPLIGIVLFVLAGAVIHHEVDVYHWQDIKAALLGIPLRTLFAMLGFTLLGYLTLSLYDWLALEYAGEKLAYHRVLLTSFVGYAVSNTVGHALFSGGSMRYRFYSNWGLSAVSIARIVLFCSVTFLIGALTLMVAGYAVIPEHSLLTRNLSEGYAIRGIITLATVVLFLWWGMVLFYRKPVSIRGFLLTMPGLSLSLRQTLVALVDILLASLVLYMALSHYTGMPFGTFLVLFIMAQLAGLFSQVPGGIGVFEGSFLFLASGQYPSSQILAALIAFRVVYYFLPLLFAGLLLASYELKPQRWLTQLGSTLGGIESAVPQLFSGLLLIGGAVLLFSGATPAESDRLRWLHYILPLPVIEFSHLLGSMAGVSLIFLSRAVRQRVDAAYFATIAILAVGIVASLAKGLDYEEATILSVMLVMFIPSHHLFYRKSALLSLDFPVQWIVLALLVVGTSVWLGFFSYKHVEYANDLWWEFSLHGDASRFLRSLVAIAVMFCGFALYRLLTHSARALSLPDQDMLDRAEKLVTRSHETMASLALLGDKYLLWSESGNAFLMFDTTAKFWVSMGEPVGEASEHKELAWKFREMADRHGAKIAFYQVGRRSLPLYLDLGLVMLKLGEEARVPLQEFGLQGGARQSLRHTYNKLVRQGAEFEIVPAKDVGGILPELRRISDRWLQDKQTREKRFSLGFFNEAYLKRCDIAVVKLEGRVLAFANLLETEGREELSIDLMRYVPDAPNGVMEYLTIALMLWGREQGYQWFNLGMAPLYGLQDRALAPLWHRIGHTIFRFGRDFYNFEGLYRYKDKFDPVWRSRYLAAPSGLHAAPALLAVTGLISGGLEGVMKK